jgi:Flp pilus assembly pilin Flp
MNLNRRRGAGMTEYVIIVGMIGILLIGVVERYKEQIRVTIVGTTTSFENHNIGSTGGGAKPKAGDKRTDPITGRPQTFNGTSWVND